MADLNVDELNPRIGLELGVTVKVADFQYIKPSIKLEIDVPPDRTADETLEDMTPWLLERLDGPIDALLEFMANLSEELDG